MIIIIGWALIILFGIGITIYEEICYRIFKKRWKDGRYGKSEVISLHEKHLRISDIARLVYAILCIIYIIVLVIISVKQ